MTTFLSAVLALAGLFFAAIGGCVAGEVEDASRATRDEKIAVLLLLTCALLLALAGWLLRGMP